MAASSCGVLGREIENQAQKRGDAGEQPCIGRERQPWAQQQLRLGGEEEKEKSSGADRELGESTYRNLLSSTPL